MTDRNRLEVVEYKTWQQGSVFAKGLHPGQGEVTDYQAMNLQVYKNEMLGPRPYLKRLPYAIPRYGSPLAVNDSHSFFFDGSVFAIMDSRQLTFYSVSWGALSTALISSVSGREPVPTPKGWYAHADNYLIAQVSSSQWFISGEYTVTPGISASLAAVPWPSTFQPRGAVLWKDRIFGFGDSSVVTSPRVYYSDVYPNLTTFTSASQFFDLGAREIVAAFPLRDALLFINDRGVMYALTGSSPTSWSLREVGTLKRINGASRAAVFQNAVWQLATNGRGVVVLTPSGQETVLEWVRPTIDKSLYNAQVVPLRPGVSENFDAICFPFVGDNNTSFIGNEEVRPAAPYTGFQSIDFIHESFHWSKYWSLSSSASGYGMSDSDSTDARILGFQEWNGVLYIAVDESRLPNNSSDGVALYARNLSLNRPSNSNDFFSAAREELAGVYNDDGTSGTNQTAGELWLREFAPPPGNQVRVRKVVADVTYWDGSAYLDPAATLDVYGDGASLTTIAHTATDHTITNTNTGDSGATGRITWHPTAQPAKDSVQVRLTGMNSIAIRKIIVEYEVFPQ